MGRVSRTFKLRLSPTGVDLLIRAHCRLIEATRQLLPWGTTLYAAVTLLDGLPPEQLLSRLDRISSAGLCGNDVRFLGAPCRLNEVAGAIAVRAAGMSHGRAAPPLHLIYLLALDALVAADLPSMRSAYIRAVT
jgi:hypothetical protein